MTQETENKLKEIAATWLDCQFLEKFKKIGSQYLRKFEILKELNKGLSNKHS